MVATAARLRWRAPELALLMADQASVAAAEVGAESVRLRAEVLAVFACNQLGRGAAAGGRAVRALRAAQQAGEETTERLVRVELAACASDASAPTLGLSVLQPVFGRVPSSPTARAAALVTAADCVARLGGGSDVAVLLRCADELYDTARAVEPDAVLLRRGVVHARLAADHRRRGDHGAAESAARAGLALIEGLADRELDTGQVSGALTLELVLALLDREQAAEAVLAAQPVLQRPARPAGAPAACWLRLALVNRVHLPAGRHPLVRRLLHEAGTDAERNQLDAALVECRHLQAQLHETCAEFGEALQSVRAAYATDRNRRDTTAELRIMLAVEFGQPQPAAELRSALGEILDSYRSADPPAVLGRGRPTRPVRSRHAAPTPLPVAVASRAGELGDSNARTTPIRRAQPEKAMTKSGLVVERFALVDLVDGVPEANHVSVPEHTAPPEPPARPVGADARTDATDDHASGAAHLGGKEQAGDAGHAGEVAGADEQERAGGAGHAGEVAGVDGQERAGDAGHAAEAGNVDEQEQVGGAGYGYAAAAGGVDGYERAGGAGHAGTADDVDEREQDGGGDHTGAGKDAGPPINGYDRGAGRHRCDTSMADLHAEAKAAHQNGRRSQLATVSEAKNLPTIMPPFRLADLPGEMVWREPPGGNGKP